MTGPSLLPLSGQVKKLVILFHGYGADGNDLISLAESWYKVLPDTEFIAPNAPTVCDQSAFGRQWFSMLDWTLEKILHGLRNVSPVVSQFIDQARTERHLQPEDIALVGFSQGAMLALYQGYYVLNDCAGVIGYSGAFLEDQTIQPKNLPRTLLVHGDADQVVPVEATILANEIIQRFGGSAQTVIREGLPHGIDNQGLALGREFLQNVLGYEKIDQSS